MLVQPIAYGDITGIIDDMAGMMTVVQAPTDVPRALTDGLAASSTGNGNHVRHWARATSNINRIHDRVCDDVAGTMAGAARSAPTCSAEAWDSATPPASG